MLLFSKKKKVLPHFVVTNYMIDIIFKKLMPTLLEVCGGGSQMLLITVQTCFVLCIVAMQFHHVNNDVASCYINYKPYYVSMRRTNIALFIMILVG